MSRDNSYRTGGLVLTAAVLAAIGYFYLSTKPEVAPVPVASEGELSTPVESEASTTTTTGQSDEAAADAATQETAASDGKADEVSETVAENPVEAAAAEEVADEAQVVTGTLTAEQTRIEIEKAAEKAQAEAEETARRAQIVAEAAAAVKKAAEDARIAAEQAVSTAQAPAEDVALAPQEGTAATQDAVVAVEEPAEEIVAVREPVAEITDSAEPTVEPEAVEPEAAAAVDAVSEPVADAPVVELPETDQTRVVTDINVPSFDLVRVAPDGGSVIAGRAQPNTTVDITVDGKVVGSATANSRGEFVALLTAPRSEKPLSLGLIAQSDGGVRTPSATNVLILSTTRNQPDAGDDVQDAPIVVRETTERFEIIQPAPLPVPEQVVIDTIGYDREGAVEISGRGRPTFLVRLYMNGRFVEQTEVDDRGIWTMTLSDVAPGRYTLRVDEVDRNGKVASRAETPFQRIFPDQLPDVGDAGEGRYTVQPGNNLWTIAKNHYGEGLDYWQIFRANKGLIRDPDLIYPGQVFALPE